MQETEFLKGKGCISLFLDPRVWPWGSGLQKE